MYLGKYLLLKAGLQQINAIFLEYLKNLNWDPKTNIFSSFFLIGICAWMNVFVKFFCELSSLHFQLTFKAAFLVATFKESWKYFSSFTMPASIYQLFTWARCRDAAVTAQTRAVLKFPWQLTETHMKVLETLCVSCLPTHRCLLSFSKDGGCVDWAIQSANQDSS